MKVGNLKYEIDQDRNDCVVVAGLWSNITSINIPSEIKHEGKTYKVIGIGKYAISNCPSLTSITIHDSVKKIGGNILGRFHNIKEITLPRRYVENICEIIQTRNKLKITII